MTLIAPPKSRIKPPQWNFDPGLVDPRWRWAWEDVALLLPLSEGGGAPRAIRAVDGAHQPTVAGSPTWLASPVGLVLDYTADADQHDFGAMPSVAGAMTVALYIRVEDVAADHRVFGRFGSGANRWGLWMDAGGLNPSWAWWANDTGIGEDQDVVTVGAYQAIVGTVDDAGNMAVWVDGEQADSGAASGAPASGNDEVFLGGWDIDRAACDASVAYASIHLRVWNESQIRQWSADPFGPFRPARRRRVFVAAAGGASILPILNNYYRRRRS